MFLSLLLLPLASSDSMQWTDPTFGATYDWSALRREEPYVVLAPTSDDVLTTEYTFMLGANLPESCSKEPASAVERNIVYGQTFEECSILGRHEMRVVALLDSRDPERGVMVTYSGGHICSSAERMIFNEPRRVVFRLVCSMNGVESEFKEVDAFPFDLSECEVVIERTTHAGCPIDYVRQSQTWKMWLMFSFMLLFYFVIGTVLNCINGSRGLEAVPHSKQLIQIVYLFRSAGGCLASLCTKKAAMKTEEYEEV